MSKQYGLIVPDKNKLNSLPVKRPAIFGSDGSDSDDNRNIPTAAHQNVVRRQDIIAQQKALEEDPTVYQYDEVYDAIEDKKKESKLARKDIEKKPKYINRLLQTAARRKREYELRIERQVQREREAEGDEFKDKEEFVTSSYRKKLEELRKLEEDEKREEYLESIGDVTKQSDLGGFYRHLYEQQVKSEDNVEIKTEKADNIKTEEKKNEGPKDIKNETKKRKYRKRDKSDEDSVDSTEEKETKKEKIHLPSNLDADSDFSIESSTEESDNDNENEKKTLQKDDSIIKTENVENEFNGGNKEEEKPITNEAPLEFEPEVKIEDMLPPEPKKPKIDIWKKRTVGEVFDVALQRYFKRKNERLTRG